MNTAQKEFLQVLSYLYIQHSKHEKALTYLLALKRLFPHDPKIKLSRSYALLCVGLYKDALAEASESLLLLSKADLPIAHLLISKAHWALGHERIARSHMHLYIQTSTPED